MRQSFLAVCLYIIFSNNLYSQSWKDSILKFEDDTLALQYLDQNFNKLIYSNLIQCDNIASLYDSIAQLSYNPRYLGYAEILKGNIFFTKGEYDHALPFYIEAIRLLEPNVNLGLLAKAYNNLGSCYQVRNDTETSTSYFKKALSIYEELKDTLWIANVNSNLGLQYLNDDHLDQAETHLASAITNFDLIDNTIFKGIALLSRGNLRIQQKAYNEAINDYVLCQQLVPYKISPLVHAATEAGIGTANNKLGKYNKAMTHLKSSLEKATAINHGEQIKESNRELSSVYKSLGKYKQALNHYEAYSEAKDTLFTVEQDAKLVEALTKFESEKKENEIRLLHSQNEVQATCLSARKNQVFILGTSAILLLLLLGALYKLYDKIKKQNSVIATALNDKDTLLREIHHRVKNNLQVISALLTLQSKHVKDDLAFEALQEGEGRVRSMALIHQGLYQHDNLKGVNTKFYFEKLLENLVETYKTVDRNINLQSKIQAMLLDVDTMIPLGLLVNELICNALKHDFHSKKNGNITITLIEKDDKLHLSVKDDGKGAELFKSKNESFGFSLIKSFARRLDANINIVNDNGLNVLLCITNYQKAA